MGISTLISQCRIVPNKRIITNKWWSTYLSKWIRDLSVEVFSFNVGLANFTVRNLYLYVLWISKMISLCLKLWRTFGKKRVWNPQSVLSVSAHRIWMSNEAVFYRNSKLLGLGRQFGQIIFFAFGVFLANLSAPILVLWVLVHVFH